MRSIFLAAILLSTFAYPSRTLSQNSVIDAFEKGAQARQAQERIDNENKQRADALAEQQRQFNLELAQRRKELEQKQQNQKLTIDAGRNFSYYGTANDLMKDCIAGIAIAEKRVAADDKDIVLGIAGASRCSGYVGAFVDINEFGGGAALFCAPKQASLEQFTRVFIKYMQDNPADLHRSPISMLSIALDKAFPCVGPK